MEGANVMTSAKPGFAEFRRRLKAREHLLGLFAAVGNDDDRVKRARQNLASALF